MEKGLRGKIFLEKSKCKPNETNRGKIEKNGSS